MDKETLKTGIKLGILKYFYLLGYKIEGLGAKNQDQEFIIYLIKDIINWAKEDILNEEVRDTEIDYLIHILKNKIGGDK